MGLYSDSTSDRDSAQQAAIETANSSLSSQFPDLATMDKKLHSLVDKAFDSNNWKSLGFGSRPDWSFFENFHMGKRIPGLKAYTVPSVSQYEECKEGNGVGVWDQNGWWRCLFPRAQVTNPNELAREDVEGDAENKYGVFFKDYTSLLDWKLHVKKLVREQELQKRAEKEKDTLSEIYAEYEKDVDWFGSNSDGIISTSKSTQYKTLANGDAEEFTEIHNTFADGRTENKKFKKLIPRDGSTPVVEKVKADQSALKKWIWDNEKK